jgi:hypothetical protein
MCEDALDDAGLEALDAVDLKAHARQVVQRRSHQVVGAEADGQRVKQPLHDPHRPQGGGGGTEGPAPRSVSVVETEGIIEGPMQNRTARRFE